MDNIIFTKIWEDSGSIELEIYAVSELVSAKQNCYVPISDLHDASEKLVKYARKGSNDTYIEFGHKKGNYTPAFSMKYFASNPTGHMQIEVDLEVADIKDRSHRCCYFVNGELGAVERFGKKLIRLCSENNGTKISLFELDW